MTSLIVKAGSSIHSFEVNEKQLSILEKTVLQFEIIKFRQNQEQNHQQSEIIINVSSDHDFNTYLKILKYLLLPYLGYYWDCSSEERINNQLNELQFWSIDSSLYYSYPGYEYSDFDPFNYPLKVASLYWNKKEINLENFKEKIPIISYENETRYFPYFDENNNLILYSYSNSIFYFINYQKVEGNQYIFVEKDFHLYLIEKSFTDRYFMPSQQNTFTFYEIISNQDKFELHSRTHLTFTNSVNLDYHSFVNFPSFFFFASCGTNYYYALLNSFQIERINGYFMRTSFHTVCDSQGQHSFKLRFNNDQYEIIIPPKFFPEGDPNQFSYSCINNDLHYQYLTPSIITLDNRYSPSITVYNLINKNAYKYKNYSNDPIYYNQYKKLVFILVKDKERELIILNQDLEPVEFYLDSESKDWINNRLINIKKILFTQNHIFFQLNMVTKVFAYQYYSSQKRLRIHRLKDLFLGDNDFEIVNDQETLIVENLKNKKLLFYSQD